MSTLAEIEQALSVLAFGYSEKNISPSLAAFQLAFRSESGQGALLEKVRLLHCTTEYPAPFAEVNLRAIETMAAAFGLPVGFSDHTEGIAIPIAAAARGAIIVEKHFTLDRNLPGPDHRASLEPAELKAMVQGIRQVEAALGSGLKIPGASESRNLSVARKSIVASREIPSGGLFSEENLAVKRPGGGVSPMRYWELLGKVTTRRYGAEEPVVI
jgi:N-acetylneuraminate synthase